LPREAREFSEVVEPLKEALRFVTLFPDAGEVQHWAC
jgi:hypothetical protein